ncbi:MAG: hypothetical protein OEU92_05345, partial [Alphaproteobacteria bacterium]|nr:hypothetical protein [Alphaproteobacteria bacterium]
MRRWLRFGLYAIALVLIVLIGALGFIQTGPGKRLLAEQLSSRLSTADAAIEIAGIEGWIPLDLGIGTFRLSDRDGVWLEANDVAFDWSPSALFGGRIRIDRIGAARVEIMRPPLADPTPEPASDKPFRLPELPKSLPPITVERLALPEVLLGAPLVGEAASFGLMGSIRANDDGDRVTAKLDLERTDTATAFASLELTAGLDPRTLDLALNAGESGGVLAALADRPEIGEVELSLEGQGALEDWSGRLSAQAEGLALLEADLGLALVDQPRLVIDGTADLAPGALPDDIAALVGDRIAIELDLVQTAAQALDLKSAAMTTALAVLDAEGSVDFDDGDLALRTGLAIPDLAPLGPFAEAALSGKAEAHLMIGGTLTAPEGELALRIGAPAFDDKTAEAIATDIRWTTTTPLSADRPAFDIVIEGQALGFAIPGTVLPDEDARFSARLSLPLEGEVVVDHVTIESAGSSIEASGAIDPAELEGRIDLALDAPSLSRLAAPYGQAVDGKALVKAAIQLADRAKNIAVDLDASLDELAGLPPGAAELLGKQVALEAKVSLDPSRRVTLEKLTADGANVELEGDASLDLAEKGLTGRLSAALPDLTALGTLAPDGTEGAIALEADLGGSLDAPEADLRVSGQDLVLAGEPISAFGLTLAGRDLIAAPNGDLAIEITARDMPAKLALAYRLVDDRLHLDAIDLTAPETEIDGALVVALDTTLAEGSLQGGIAKLHALEPLIQQAIGGSLDFTATLAPEGERQNADLVISGRDIGGSFGSLKTIDVDASVVDVKTRPTVDAKASLTGFEQGATAIDALTVAARSDGDKLAFELDVAGEALKPFELAADGAVVFADGVELGLESLNGSFAGERLRLAQPLTLRQAESGMQLAGLDLRFGKARLQGDVDIGEETVSGAVDLRDLPLDWSEVFGGPALTGDASADIDLSGSVSSPKV